MTSAALVVFCDHGHAAKLITQALKAGGSFRYVFKFCICSLAAGHHKTLLPHLVAVWNLVNIKDGSMFKWNTALLLVRKILAILKSRKLYC